MSKYALDSNIVTYYLKGDANIIERIADETDRGNTFVIPPIVFFEIKRWLLTINSKKKLLVFESMEAYSGIGSIDKADLELSSSIYAALQKNGITLSDNDVIIAAFCIQYDCILVTNNIKHFREIPNLKAVNWLEH
jgi:predicted nucleic acid-binding protein